MKPIRRILLALLCCIAGASLAFGQQLAPPVGYITVLPATKMAPKDSAAALLSPAVSPLIPNKSFNYTIAASGALGGGVYSGTILGRNPTFRGQTTTTIPTQIIPLVITINDGTTTVTYDPTAPDACVPGTPTDVSVITGSPIFTKNSWTMNTPDGTPGGTQYIDAFQRAEFGRQGPVGYHLILNSSVLGGQALTFGPGSGTNYVASSLVPGACGNIGVVNLATLDAAVQALITGPLAPTVNAGTFPIFLTKDVVSATSGISIFTSCCVLGYHSGLSVGPNLQIYSPFSIDTTGIFGPGYVSTLSHEMAEAVNDPTTNNATPSWGNLGQVLGACQANLEVGDPLSPGFGTPTNPFVVVGTNGLTYHTQELAFYSWFFGSTSLGVGAGGRGSNNGSFGPSAIICPPGGTTP